MKAISLQWAPSNTPIVSWARAREAPALGLMDLQKTLSHEGIYPIRYVALPILSVLLFLMILALLTSYSCAFHICIMPGALHYSCSLIIRLLVG